jgi:hypothetical protein
MKGQSQTALGLFKYIMIWGVGPMTISCLAQLMVSGMMTAVTCFALD